MYESGLFHLNQTMIEDVHFEENKIVLKCLYQEVEFVHVTFLSREESDNRQSGICEAVGRVISFIDVVEKGYELHFDDDGDTVLLSAYSFHFDRE